MVTSFSLLVPLKNFNGYIVLVSPVPQKLHLLYRSRRLYRSRFFGHQQIVTATSLLVYEKSGSSCYFVTSRLLKVVVCNDCYQRCNGNRHRGATNFFSNIFANNSTHCFYKDIWLGCTRHSGIIDTAVPIWHRCDFGPHIREALATFKGNICKKTYIGKLSCTVPVTFTQKILGLTRDRSRIQMYQGAGA
jgi:hypothetical protein